MAIQLAKLKAQNKGPAVLAFVCQWSEFSALDNPNSAFEGKNVLALEVPCFKSLDPVHVVNALNCGFDGVMAVVCSSTRLQASRRQRHCRTQLERNVECAQKEGSA